MASESAIKLKEFLESDKSDIDIITLVKELGMDDPDFDAEEAAKIGTYPWKQVEPGWFDARLKEYEDVMQNLQTGGGLVSEKGDRIETFTLEEVDPDRPWKKLKKYAKQPGKRGIPSKSDLFYSKQRDKAHKDFMKIKEEEKRLAEEKKDLSIWQRMGKHFGENADKRDQLFSMLGSMGREMVKPIEPGKEAAGALLPTLSRGFEKGEEAWAAKEAAETKRMVDLASARANINPLQYYSNAMKEARLMVPENIEGGADGAAGKAWIGNYLRSIGIPSQVVDLSNAITEAQLLLTTAPEDQRESLQKNINDMIIQQNTLLSQMMGGGSTDSGNVPYLGG